MTKIERAEKLADWLRNIAPRDIPIGGDKFEKVVLIGMDLEQRELLLKLLDIVPLTADSAVSSELIGIRFRNEMH